MAIVLQDATFFIYNVNEQALQKMVGQLLKQKKGRKMDHTVWLQICFGIGDC
jgi:hypothetical protein